VSGHFREIYDSPIEATSCIKMNVCDVRSFFVENCPITFYETSSTDATEINFSNVS
jgi:hypothetical protein